MIQRRPKMGDLVRYHDSRHNNLGYVRITRGDVMLIEWFIKSPITLDNHWHVDDFGEYLKKYHDYHLEVVS